MKQDEPIYYQDFNYDDPEPPPIRQIDDTSVVEFLRHISDCVERCPSRLDVIHAWVQIYDGRPIRGGSGIISEIARHTGLHHVTVLRHIQHISDHKVLGKVLKYHNSKSR